MNDLKAKAVSLLVDVWQNGDYAQLPRICQPNIVRHHDRIGASGLGQYRMVIEHYRSAFANLRYDIIESVENGSKVAIVYKVTGTHVGQLGSIPATGVTDTVWSIDFFVFEDGRISDVYTLFDEIGMLIKLGVVKA